MKETEVRALLLVMLVIVPVRASVAGASGPIQGATAATFAGASLCNGPRDAQGATTVQCFSPRKVAHVEALLGFHALRPTATVALFTRLTLTQVAITKGVCTLTSSGYRAARAKVFNVSYVFGDIPLGPGETPDFGGQTRYVVVIENAGHRAALTKANKVQLINVTPGGTDVTGVANMPNRHVLAVESNLGRTMVKRMIVALLAAARASRRLADVTHSAITVSRGVKLTVALPHGGYPRNALVRVTVMLQNVSRHMVYLANECGGDFPPTSVLSDAHRVLYPPGLHFPFRVLVPACAAPPEIAVRPSQRLTWQPFVILRGPNVRSVVKFFRGGAQPVSATLRVQLLPSAPPRVETHTSGQLYATIHRSFPGQGPLAFIDWRQCAQRGNAPQPQYEGTTFWQFAHSTRIVPSTAGVASCRVRQWHALVGFLGHSVAPVDYVSQSRSNAVRVKKGANGL